MRSGTSNPTGYVVRFGFDRRTVLILVGCVAFVVLSVWLPLDGGDLWRLPPQIMWAVKVAGVLLFGVGGVVFAIGVAGGGVALSVDRQGITLGSPRMPQPGMTNRPVQVAWDQVAEVVLFHQYHVGGRVPYVGWRLDEQRLCEAVAEYAPAVDVVRLDESGNPQPVAFT